MTYPQAMVESDVSRRRSRIITGIVTLLAVVVFLGWADNFLQLDADSVEVDATVLFVGPEFNHRKHEAESLVQEKSARYIIIPAYGRIDHPQQSGKNIIADEYHPRLAPLRKKFKSLRIVENTHLEIIVAYRMMERLGTRSAVLVSSLYHMRRIRIIAESVFDEDKYKLSYRPTRYEQTAKMWFLSPKDVRWVFSEYWKIFWFYLYSIFL